MAESFFCNVRLETERLVLRTFTSNDKEEFYLLAQDPEIYKTLPEDHMYNRKEIDGIIEFFIHCYSVNRINNIPKFALAIILKKNDKMIGNVGIGHFSQDKQKTEIFYFLNSRYWNKKYASEAVEALLQYVKEKKLVTKIIGTVVQNNTASARILRKNGFKHIKNPYNDGGDMYELAISTIT